MAFVDQMDPQTTYESLAAADGAILIDVRTQAEWSFVGAPDLSGLGKATAFIEWQSFPTMAVDPDFAEKALSAADRTGSGKIFFICRSGARSMHAAIATAGAAAELGREIACVNVSEGFEGDLNADGRRGHLNGWKARGLPWRQS